VASHEGRAGGPPTSAGNYQRFAELTSGLRRLYPHAPARSFGPEDLVTVTLYSR
jgi:hypothetical protein